MTEPAISIDPQRDWRAKSFTFGQLLVVAMAFLLPGKLAPINVVAVLIILSWLLSFRRATHWNPLRRHPFFWACQAYFWMVALGLLWTEDFPAGLMMLDHALPLAILVPALLTFGDPARFERVISAFLTGIGICVVLAHYNWLQLVHFPQWPASPLDHQDPIDTAPFTGWVSYAPMLAWAAYLCGRRLLHRAGWSRFGYGMLMLAIVNNLIFSNGRTGLVAFCALILLLTFQVLSGRRLLASIVALSLVGITLGIGYLVGDEYRQRLDRGLAELSDYRNHVDGSVSSRIVMAKHTWQMIRANPLVGVGSGDWRRHYRELNDRHTPDWIVWREPHNQFLLTQSTLGVIGLVILLLIYFPLGLRNLPYRDGRDDLRIALAVWFTSMSLFGSYLWDSHSNLNFLLFGCLIWSGTTNRESVEQKLQFGPNDIK